ncbi:MAG: chemiosmotic efflux system protein, partial [Akkermansiaceae bacterium]|nr:chemiosmotic efflux system protein [Akkermansiaceae bacterium]
MSKLSLWIALALVPAVLPLRAEPSLVVSLGSVGDRIRAQNPDLAAARLRIREALGRLKQSGRLANPELEAAFDHSPDFRDRKLELGFSQRFPLTDRLRLEKTVSATEVQASEAEVREVGRKLTAQARESVVKVISFRQRRELLKQQSGLYKDLSDTLADASKKGEGSALDAGLAKLEGASLLTESRQLDAAEAAEIGALKPLLGMQPGEALSVSGTLSEPAAVSKDLDPSQRPDFQAAKLDALSAWQSVQLERSKKYEDVEAG